jgi:VanZ family protein
MALKTDRIEFQSKLMAVKTTLRFGALFALLAICVLSLVPGEYRPHTMILPAEFEHVAAYTVAALFLGLARAGRLSAPRLVLMLTVYGGLLELCQLWIPGRNAQVMDIAADFVGASIGVLVASVLMHFYRKLTSTKGSLYLG